jgi:hypothetical protein
MLGFTLDATVWDEFDSRAVTVLVSLDTDTDEPIVDIRLKDGDGSEYIANVSVDDLYDVACELRRQRDSEGES